MAGEKKCLIRGQSAGIGDRSIDEHLAFILLIIANLGIFTYNEINKKMTERRIRSA